MTIFTLCDLDDANQVGSNEGERATSNVAHRSVATRGRASILTFGLGKQGEDGQTVAVAEGADLIERASAEAARLEAVR